MEDFKSLQQYIESPISKEYQPTSPDIWYDQEFFEDLADSLIAAELSYKKPYANNLFSDSDLRLTMKTFPEVSDMLGQYDANDNQIKIYTPRFVPQKERKIASRDLTSTWMHEAQHQRDFEGHKPGPVDEKRIIEIDDKLFPGNTAWALQRGEQRAVARQLGYILHELGVKEPRSLEDIKDLHPFSNASDAHNYNIGKILTYLISRNKGHKMLYGGESEEGEDFFQLVKEAMEEGKLKHIKSDNRLKETIIANKDRY